jgi:hypothetical protein
MIQPHSPFLDDVDADNRTSGVIAAEINGSPQKRLRLAKSRTGRGRDYLSSELAQRALAIFYERHHAVEFCSFLHVPSLDTNHLRRQSPFFAHALIALSSLYFTDEEAAKEDHESPRALSEWHAAMAREFSRRCVDSPSSMHTFYAAFIQSSPCLTCAI